MFKVTQDIPDELFVNCQECLVVCKVKLGKLVDVRPQAQIWAALEKRAEMSDKRDEANNIGLRPAQKNSDPGEVTVTGQKQVPKPAGH